MAAVCSSAPAGGVVRVSPKIILIKKVRPGGRTLESGRKPLSLSLMKQK
jgi:hypothetical protein